MRFNRDSGEESCPKTIHDDPRYDRYGGLACMRVSGHDGECISGVRDAALADGVCWECRRLVGAFHREACVQSVLQQSPIVTGM